MESEIQHEIENEQQFWNVLEASLSKECATHDAIDDALRSYLTLIVSHTDYVQTEDDIRSCAFKLYSSQLFSLHGDYVRRQFVHCLLQEDEAIVLHVVITLLLADARERDSTFALLNHENMFPHLIETISHPRPDGNDDLHRLFMELLYEMARVQKIPNDDLMCIDDDFICFLFGIIEQVSGDVEDPYHYPVIRLLLVMNEQFMVAAHDPVVATHKIVPMTNKVMKTLSTYGNRYKTFGENIILLLNREDETSLQLLTLKLLYLLFTTPPTYEYFYTNDLHVLVDILIRNLLDLPEEASALRHTYLRVLYPLLEHTQLKHPPHYKQQELRKLMSILGGGQISLDCDSPSFSHFEEVDDTTKRLVHRCQTVSWLKPSDEEEDEAYEPLSPSTSEASQSSPAKAQPPALPAPRKLRKRTTSKPSGSGPDFLVPRLESARHSSLSVAEIAVQREKPGIRTPSRNPSVKHGLRAAILQRKEKPPPPKARRSGSARFKVDAQEETGTGHDASLTRESVGTEPDAHMSASTVAEHNVEEAKSNRRPPPAPKARRWRGNKVKPAVGDGQPERQVADIEAPLVTNSRQIDQSPFSPPEEKTLSPMGNLDGTTDKKSKRISSVSAALEQAQAQALQDLEHTFEKATIHEEEEESRDIAAQVRTVQAVLAPPSSAPRRDVPGPKVELGESPFLAQEEVSIITPVIAERIEEESEDEWN